jgi:hypothetical protein
VHNMFFIPNIRMAYKKGISRKAGGFP